MEVISIWKKGHPPPKKRDKLCDMLMKSNWKKVNVKCMVIHISMVIQNLNNSLYILITVWLEKLIVSSFM